MLNVKIKILIFSLFLLLGCSNKQFNIENWQPLYYYPSKLEFKYPIEWVTKGWTLGKIDSFSSENNNEPSTIFIFASQEGNISISKYSFALVENGFKITNPKAISINGIDGMIFEAEASASKSLQFYFFLPAENRTNLFICGSKFRTYNDVKELCEEIFKTIKYKE